MAATQPAIASAEIGVVAAVNRDVTGARPAQQARPLFIRDQLVTNERIRTSAVGGGQVLFIDQTSLTLAPGTDIVLDKYVYDPAADSGSLSVSIQRGAMRLIGGRISKSGVATIRTPSATIGIRGGIGFVTVGADGSTRYTHVAGNSSTIDAGGATLTITREGGTAEVPAKDAAPVYTGMASEQSLEQAYAPASAGSGDGGSATGGAPETISRESLTLAAVVSGAEGAATAQPISTQGERQPTAEDTGGVTTDPPNDELANQRTEDAVEGRSTTPDEPTEPLIPVITDPVDPVDPTEPPIVAVIDGVRFFGPISFSANIDGVPTTLTRDFDMTYSIVSESGVVSIPYDFIGLENEVFAVTGVQGGNIGVGPGADGPVMAVDPGLMFLGDANFSTRYGGSAAQTSLQVDLNGELQGTLMLDYPEVISSDSFTGQPVTITGDLIDLSAWFSGVPQSDVTDATQTVDDLLAMLPMPPPDGVELNVNIPLTVTDNVGGVTMPDSDVTVLFSTLNGDGVMLIDYSFAGLPGPEIVPFVTFSGTTFPDTTLTTRYDNNGAQSDTTLNFNGGTGEISSTIDLDYFFGITIDQTTGEPVNPTVDIRRVQGLLNNLGATDVNDANDRIQLLLSILNQLNT